MDHGDGQVVSLYSSYYDNPSTHAAFVNSFSPVKVFKN